MKKRLWPLLITLVACNNQASDGPGMVSRLKLTDSNGHPVTECSRSCKGFVTMDPSEVTRQINSEAIWDHNSALKVYSYRNEEWTFEVREDRGQSVVTAVKSQ